MDEVAENNKAPPVVALSIGSGLLSRITPAYQHESQTLPVEEDTTIAKLLDRIGLPQELALLIVLNDTLVVRTAVATQRLSNGDRLSLMPPIHAG